MTRNAVFYETKDVVVVTVGEAGPPGAQGPPGTGGTGGSLSYTKTANEAISAYRVVVSDGATGVLLAHNTVLPHRNLMLGITETAASLGASITVRVQGEITFGGWAWTPGLPLFLGTAGMLTHTPPSFPAFSRMVAVAVTATLINASFREPIQLS